MNKMLHNVRRFKRFILLSIYHSCEDRTLASIWKRSQSFDEKEAPFSKLSLSKLLVLKDKATREDYFAQQAAFVMEEGRKDVHAVSI